MKVIPFSTSRSTSAQLDAWYALKLDVRLETLPDEPVIFSRNSLVERVEAMKAVQESQRWAVWNSNGDIMTGLAGVYRSSIASENSPVWFSLEVDRNFRRAGIGRTLLETVASTASERDWKYLKVKTCDKSPSGDLFIEKTGADRIHRGHTSRVEVGKIARELLGEWLQYPTGEPGISLGEWHGSIPEDRLKEVSDFYQTVYDAGRGQHETSGFTFSPETVRKGEQAVLSGGNNRHILFASDTKTRRLLGFTEITWAESEPSVISQGYTAVLPGARERGIARRLKAEMLMNIYESIPEAVYMKTGNAGSNHAILKINSDLGFRRQLTRTTWQIETSALVEYLNEERQSLRVN